MIIGVYARTCGCNGAIKRPGANGGCMVLAASMVRCTHGEMPHTWDAKVAAALACGKGMHAPVKRRTENYERKCGALFGRS